MPTRNFALDRVASIVLFITAFLLPFFFIPTQSVALDMSKTFLLVVGVVISFSLYLVSVVKKGELSLPFTKVLWAALLIPAAFFVSGLLSGNPHLSLVGYNLEVGTAAFVALGFVLMFLASVLFNTRERIFYAYLGFIASFVIIAVIALVKFFFGSATLSLGGVFAGNVVSPVGSLTDLAVFFGASSIILLLALEELALTSRTRGLLYAGLIISIFSVAVISVPAVWIGLLIFSLVFFLYTFSFGSAGVSETGERRISYGALVLLLLSLLFVWNPTVSTSGAKLGDQLAQKFNVVNLEVSPSLSATYQVSRPVIKENPIFGSGPNTFDTDWLAHKPSAVNTTIFWNAPFAYGLGLLSTFVATTGVLGSILWLLFLVFFIRLGMKAIFNRNTDKIMHFLTMSSFTVALFLFILDIFTVPSKTIFSLAFIFAGLFIATAALSGVVTKKVILFRNSSKLAFVAVLLLVAVLVGNVAYAYGAIKQSVAGLYFNKASIAASTNNLDLARTDALRAANLSGEDIYYSGLAQIGVARANKILSNASSTPEQAKASFQAALSETIAASQAAVSARPDNYANWISLGQLYESLVPAPLSVQGAYDSAKSAYEEAKKRNPESPEPYYLEARLEFENKNASGARDLIKQALQKKNDYADAYYLLTQIEISDNNIPEAIKNAQTLTVLQPTNAGLEFQLGLLKYSGADYQGAADALAQALTISPDYANAKYYYGLTLDKLGRHEEAVAEFEALLKSNPDNQELPSIISNIKAGKDPLPKAAAAPSKTTPPIAGQGTVPAAR
jgi:cytochrome c-type biogenesis protein CcmH/NrfG